MTELTITPKTADKTARFKGAIAAGEHVAVTIKGGADWLGEDNGAHLSLRVLDLVTGRTLAIFPRPPETEETDSVSEPSASADAETDAETETEPQTDAWSTTGDDNADLYCELNLNTTRMVNAARHMLQVPVLFVMGEKDDQSDVVTRTLYFRDRYEVGFWPERIGDDTPYDLDRWPKQIDEWTDLIAEFETRIETAEEDIAQAKEDVDAVVESIDGKVADSVSSHLSGKADKVANATGGNLAALGADGNLVDSGKKPADFADAAQFTAHKNNTDIHFSAAERAKLSGIAAGAQVNVIETIERNGVALPVTNKKVSIAVPTHTSDLTNDGEDGVTGFATVGALNSEVSRAQGAESALSSRVGAVEGKIPSEASSSNQLADKAHVAAAIAAVKNSRFAVVDELPSSGEENVIYLVPAEDGAGDDVFDEYIWLVGSGGVGAWEKIASTRIDLSGYATTVGVNALLSGKVDKETGKGLSSNDYTAGDKAKVAVAATGADVANAVAPCLTRAEAVDGYTKWEVDTIAPAYGLISCEWNESSTPGDTGWLLTMLYQNTQVSLLLQGDHDATSLTYPDIITLSRTRIHPAIDAALSPTSENPVQNKAVKAAVDGKRGLDDLAVYAEETAWDLESTSGAALVLIPASENVWESEDGDWTLGWDNGTWYLVCEPALLSLEATGASSATSLEFTREATGDTYSLMKSGGDTEYYPIATSDALAKVSQLPAVPSASTAAPQMDGTASAGSSSSWAKGDHVHPRDTSKLDGEAVYPIWNEAVPYGSVGTVVSWNGRLWRNNAQTMGDAPGASAYWDEVFLKDVKANAYDFSAVQTISSARTEQSPNEVTPVDAQNKRVSVEATNAYIAVALPAASANGHIRDFMLTLDCSSLTDGQEPTVTWGTNFHPRTDAGTDFACAAGVRNVYYISEYAAGEFVVGGWTETEGGNT